MELSTSSTQTTPTPFLFRNSTYISPRSMEFQSTWIAMMRRKWTSNNPNPSTGCSNNTLIILIPIPIAINSPMGTKTTLLLPQDTTIHLNRWCISHPCNHNNHNNSHNSMAILSWINSQWTWTVANNHNNLRAGSKNLNDDGIKYIWL